MVRVCKRFFMATFALTEARVKSALRGRSAAGIFTGPDMRGHAAIEKKRMISEELRAPVREFLKTLPFQKPHYSRTQGCRDAYLDIQGMSLNDLYRKYFIYRRRNDPNERIASRSTFYTVFNKDFNLGLCRPKKDKCNTCGKFEKTKSEELKLQLLEECEHVILYSDTCAEYIPNIQSITQKFMESGHSEMEVDSAHPAIENFRRNQTIYTGEDWHFVIRNARKVGKPYAITDLKFHNFYDLHELADQYNILEGGLKDVTNAKVQITEVKQLIFEKNDGITKLSYSYGYDAETLVEVNLRPLNTTKRTRNMGVRKELTRAYINKIPISNAKKADLMGLCHRGIIPVEAHAFYAALSSADDVEDRLAQPGEDEEEHDYEF